MDIWTNQVLQVYKWSVSLPEGLPSFSQDNSPLSPDLSSPAHLLTQTSSPTPPPTPNGLLHHIVHPLQRRCRAGTDLLVRRGALARGNRVPPGRPGRPGRHQWRRDVLRHCVNGRLPFALIPFSRFLLFGICESFEVVIITRLTARFSKLKTNNTITTATN